MKFSVYSREIVDGIPDGIKIPAFEKFMSNQRLATLIENRVGVSFPKEISRNL